METFLKYRLDAGVATLEMDDGKTNAMSVPMLRALDSALCRAEADDAIVVIAGRDGIFSAGFDLAVFKRDPQELLQMLEAGARLTERLLSFPRPVIAACTGHAIAMGVFLLLSCDVRIGIAGNTRIHVNEVQLGLTLPHFAIEICRQRLSPAHLVFAALAAQPYSPQDAVAAGFLDEVVAAESFGSVVHAHAVRMKRLDAESFAATKQRLRRPFLDALGRAIDEDIADWSSRFLQPRQS